jgi:hypothetical protein
MNFVSESYVFRLTYEILIDKRPAHLYRIGQQSNHTK